MNRRLLLASALGAALPAFGHGGHGAHGPGGAKPVATPAAAAPRSPIGLVLPRTPAPAVVLTGHDGRVFNLAERLRDRISCAQLMFAGCSATCPLQGAAFAALAREAGLPRELQLLSITVDPLGDGPEQLTRWLERHGRVPSFWSAATPRPADVEAISGFLRGMPHKGGAHSSQAFLFDRDARLAFRTVDLPTPEHLADLLRQLASA